MNLRFATAAISAALTLSACGGGGGGDDNDNGGGSGSLSTSEQVAHELSVLTQVTGIGEDDGSVAAAATPTRQALARSNPIRQRALRAPSKGSATASAAAPAPSAASTNPCSGGGTATTDSGSKSYNFGYFSGPTAPVDYRTESDANCVDEDGDTTNGFQEYGYTGAAVSGFSYTYYVLGSGSTPFTERDIEKEGNTTTSDLTYTSLGQFQIKQPQDGSSTIFKTVDQERIKGTDSGQSLDVSYQLGTSSMPFTISQAAAGLSLDGSYGYDLVGHCSGDYQIATTSPLVNAQESSTPTGGTIKLSTDGSSVTVTFQQDGSAVLQFGNGGTATLTRDQIENADPLDC